MEWSASGVDKDGLEHGSELCQQLCCLVVHHLKLYGDVFLREKCGGEGARCSAEVCENHSDVEKVGPHQLQVPHSPQARQKQRLSRVLRPVQQRQQHQHRQCGHPAARGRGRDAPAHCDQRKTNGHLFSSLNLICTSQALVAVCVPTEEIQERWQVAAGGR